MGVALATTTDWHGMCHIALALAKTSSSHPTHACIALADPSFIMWEDKRPD